MARGTKSFKRFIDVVFIYVINVIIGCQLRDWLSASGLPEACSCEEPKEGGECEGIVPYFLKSNLLETEFQGGVYRLITGLQGAS